MSSFENCLTKTLSMSFLGFSPISRAFVGCSMHHSCSSLVKCQAKHLRPPLPLPSPLLSGLSQHRDVFFMFPGDALKGLPQSFFLHLLYLVPSFVVAPVAVPVVTKKFNQRDHPAMIDIHPREDPAVLESTRVAGLKGDDGGETKAFCYFRVFRDELGHLGVGDETSLVLVYRCENLPQLVCRKREGRCSIWSRAPFPRSAAAARCCSPCRRGGISRLSSRRPLS
mmetsp:Transcript_17782/g.40255  ORF Transcript_17782/g.40255 Transcript_17782/m.40255 type:complete len:225 (-) Transcript_17782:1228-1902(-)